MIFHGIETRVRLSRMYVGSSMRFRQKEIIELEICGRTESC